MKIVICVEGDSDIKFIKDFVNYYDFKLLSNEINYIKSDGKDGLSSIKKNLIQPDEDGFNIIIQDLDLDNEEERRVKASQVLNGYEFKLFLIKGGSCNCLDGLLELSSVHNLEKFDDCWNNFNDCLSPIEFVKNKLGLKDKLHVYKLMCLTPNEDSTRDKIMGVKKIDYRDNRFFNLEDKCFSELKCFFATIED